MEPLFQAQRPQSIFVLVPGVGTKAPNEWHDRNRQLWLRSLPPGISAFAFNHKLSPKQFSWQRLFGQGDQLLKQLAELIEHHSQQASKGSGSQKLPVVIIAHSVGGIIVKEALCSVFEQKNQYRELLETLAGIVLLGTPHSISGDDRVWADIPYAIEQGSKAKALMDADAREKLAGLSRRFVQAAADVQVLSCHELRESKAKSSLLSSSKLLITPRKFVQIKFPRERVLGLDADHKGLCDFDVGSREFRDVASFIETALEDARLRITTGSPDYDIPEALAALTVRDVSDIESLDQEKSHDNKGGGSSSDPPSDPLATRGSSDAPIGDIQDMSNFASTLPNPRLPCHIIPSSRNADFYGRADVLEELDKIFLARSTDDADSVSSGKALTMFALVGPGGMGKTQIATEFVHSRKDRFDAIFWVYADRPVKVSDGFSKIASELGLVPDESSDAKDPVVVRENVKGWMANPVKSYDQTAEHSVKKAAWLLVFDNADNSDVIGDYWPVDGPGCVLLTSRYPLHLDGIEDRVLQPFAPPEAVDFLSRLTKRHDDPDERTAGEEVARRLGGLPLAMTQMAGIITRRDLSFTEFLAAYDEREERERLFGTRMDIKLIPRRVSTYEHTLASVWALESLKHGRALLDVLSFLDPDGVPEAVLTAYLSRKGSSSLSVRVPPLLHDYPRSASEYQRARTELLQSSLISRERTSKSVAVHRLVQDVARAKASPPRLRLAFSTCLHLVAAQWPFEAFGWRHAVKRWAACGELFPHVLKLMDFSEKVEGLESDVAAKFHLAKLLTDAGWFYHESGNSLEALPFFERAQELGEFVKRHLADELFTDDESPLSADDVAPMLAEIHHNIGCVATETNKPADAVHHFTIFNHMMAEEARVHDKRKEYAISWNELGIAYMMNEAWKDAERCFLRSIEIMEDVDASAKELQSLPTVNLGLAYWLQGGRLEEADAVLMAGLRDREAIYGPDDRESFITGRFLHAIGNVKADLAEARVDADLRDESRMYHQKALSHYRDTVGKNHHRTADTCVKVADHCIRLNMLDNAVSLLDQALKVFTSRPVYLPERARAIFKKSRVLHLLGRADEAAKEKEASVELLRELVDVGERTVDQVADADFDGAIVFWSK